MTKPNLFFFTIIISAFWQRGLSQDVQRRTMRPNEYKVKRPCTLYRRRTTYTNQPEDRTWLCLLDEYDGGAIVDPPSNLDLTDAVSGETTLFAEGLTVVNGQAQLEDASTAKFGETRHRDRRLAVSGRKFLTVVRVTCGNSRVTKSLANLKRDVFYDPACLKSVLRKCSNNALKIRQGRSSQTQSRGAMEVSITDCGNVDSAERAVTSALTSRLGVSPHAGNNRHFLYCMPPITGFDDAVGYAYINGHILVLNNHWCSMVSAQVHEIGHNFNLDHARDESDYTAESPDDATYGDHTGLMGISYHEDDMNMCYNAPNMFQLGWIKSGSVRKFTTTPSGTYKLRGHTKFSGTGSQLIRLVGTPAGSDTYIWFNHAVGINKDTMEGRNQVIVNTRRTGTGVAQSQLAAKLGVNGYYNPGNTYYSVRVVSIKNGTATVSFGT